MATFGILVLNEKCRPSIHSCQLMVLLIRCKTSSAVPKSKLTNFFSLFQILIKAQKSREKDLIALTGIYVKEGLECKLRPLSAKRGNSLTCILPCIVTLCIVLCNIVFIVSNKISLEFQRREDCITFNTLSEDLLLYDFFATKLIIRLTCEASFSSRE